MDILRGVGIELKNRKEDACKSWLLYIWFISRALI
jgi:hypothetical protein